MIIATLSFTVPKERRAEVMNCLQLMAGPTQAQPGCLMNHFFQDVSEKETFGLLQEWKTQGDLMRFLRTREYRGVLELIELSRIAPEIRFLEVEQLRGLDLIEEARLPKKTAG